MVMSNYMHSLVCAHALLPFVNMYKFYRNLQVKTVSHTDSSVVQVLCAMVMQEGYVNCITPPPPPMLVSCPDYFSPAGAKNAVWERDYSHAGFGDDSDDTGITPPPLTPTLSPGFGDAALAPIDFPTAPVAAMSKALKQCRRTLLSERSTKLSLLSCWLTSC